MTMTMIPEPARNGLRRIPNTGIGVTVQERDNTVSIQMDWRQRGVDLEISVPRRTSVRAKTVNGGDVTVVGVTGEHEISNVNGGIVARDIAGSIVANTTNGDVEASFAEVTAGKPMSFSSFNGDIEVAFPASLKAALRINGGRGDVWTTALKAAEANPTMRLTCVSVSARSTLIDCTSSPVRLMLPKIVMTVRPKIVTPYQARRELGHGCDSATAAGGVASRAALSFTRMPGVANCAGMVPRRRRYGTSLAVEFLFALVRMRLARATEHVTRARMWPRRADRRLRARVASAFVIEKNTEPS